MQSAEIARRYLAHFEARGHAIVPSASLVADDPTLLFVVAGMQPFKPFLLGQQTPPWKRVADVQKVVRTLDIEEVGKTTRHATFFQMLGNWSFGDYFKEDAIRWAWELLTKSEADGGFGFPEDRLWATVLHGDDESYAIWRDQVGVPESRIQRRGLKDNYWHMGVPGPGGPCSEIYFDKGPEHGRDGGPEADEDRFLEVWNLVFMQDMLSAVRAKDDFDVEAPLPFKNVDTGMGLERMASILQGVDNIYEIDTTYKILEQGGRAHRAGVRHRPAQRHRAPGRRRPRPVRGHAHRGRGAALQRGRRLRAAAAAAPLHPQPAAAVRRAARRRRHRVHRLHARAGRRHDRRDGGAVPRAAPRRAAHPHRGGHGGGGVRQHPPHRHRDLRRRGRGGQAQAHHRDDRGAGLPAARHLRLPDRPHPGDGGRAGPDRGRGRLQKADGRAARAGQEGRAGEEDRQRGHLRLREPARAGGPGHLHRLRRGGRRGDDRRAARRRGAGAVRDPRHGGRGGP